MSHDEKERDAALVRDKHNTARYFTETRHVAWVLLFATLAAGAYGYMRMPKRKDPVFQIRLCLVTCLWPGASADRVEQLVTRKLEQKIAENPNVEKIESISRSSVSVVYIMLKDSVKNRAQEFDDLKLRLDAVRDLPEGAGPIVFHKDFGDTAALMLTVASPKVSGVELELRARSLERAIRSVRDGAAPGQRGTVVINFPPTLSTVTLRRAAETAAHFLVESGDGDDVRVTGGPGFLGIDLRLNPKVTDDALIARMFEFVAQRLRMSELHPDIWLPFVVRDPATTLARMSAKPGDRYSYRELDDFTEQIQRYLQAAPLVSKVTRAGVLPEEIRLEYSQERLAANGVQQSRLQQLLATRNITLPGGVVEIGDKNISIDPSGQLKNEHEIGDMIVGASPGGAPLYLRDLVEINRDYQSPARFLNYYLSRRTPDGPLVRNRAITLAVQMRPGEQIAEFGVAVDKQLETVAKLLPEDLIVRRTSDQPLQVKEAVDLFMNSLYEAIVLVLIVTLLGFWEWRTALLMALAIPITLAMTFAFMHLAGIDIQQISIASLILALGLLIDDPVVAADAIKRSMALGWKPLVAAWLGPTKLATAILFATITNIAAYLPLLVLSGDTGSFVYSLPIVLTLSLVASRIVSMTFIPLLGSVLLRPPKHPEPPPAVRRRRGFARFYSRIVLAAMANRKLAAFLALIALGCGVMVTMLIRPSFFPKDNQYLSYVDVWLPEDSTLSATRDKVGQVSSIIEKVAAEYGRQHPDSHGKPRKIIESLTEFVGGGGPRFWLSVFPEQSQLNYAQVIIQVVDKEDTPELAPVVQRELSRQIAGALADVRELETGKPIGIPVSVRLSGEDSELLRRYADDVKKAFREIPNIERVRDDWGSQTFSVKLAVDPDRANLAGVTNLDVAVSSGIAMNGHTVSILREGDKQIPILARLRVEERAQLTDIKNLYVTALDGPAKVPLGAVSRISYSLETEKIRRRNQFRTITVAGFPIEGTLPSEVVAAAKNRIDAIGAKLPPGYSMEWGGEFEEQNQSFSDLVIVLVISTVAIFLALLIQFKNAVKPLIVFMTLPFGAVGALVSLVIADAPFSFMAFLGVVSLMGVIVSHVIVLFDFIEEMQEIGEPLSDALVDAGVVRLRPVLITVGATVLGLVPLAIHGGPLWAPLCFAQIGGLCVATVLTLLLVPVFYTIVVRDLGWIRWDPKAPPSKGGGRFTRTMIAMDVVD